MANQYTVKNRIPCPDCGSESTNRRGSSETKNGSIKVRIKCNDCGENNYVVQTKDNSPETPEAPKFTLDKHEVKAIETECDVFVVTSLQNNTKVNKKFRDSLITYCTQNDARLMVIPTRYKNLSMEDSPKAPHNYWWDSSVSQYMVENTFYIHDLVKIVADMNINATATNPISALEPLTEGYTTIFGHPQLQMATVATHIEDDPVIVTTTGALGQKNYSNSKAGKKAEFFHNFSAIVIEVDRAKNQFHLRQLEADDTGGFYDIDMNYYHGDRIDAISRVEALITGDEHVWFRSGDVADATYLNDDCMVAELNPRYIIRHDVLDCYSISHHHQKNTLTRYAKWKTGMNKIEDELRDTFEYILDTTPEDSTSVIIASNHNDHLTKWLNEIDPKHEPWNAKLYHELMYRMLEQTDMGDAGTEHPCPFELWSNAYHLNEYGNDMSDNIRFLERSEKFNAVGIELSLHGDKGPNGSRGSAMNLSKLGEKIVIGHCLTEDHDILTENGWVGISDYTTNDGRVLGYQDKTNVWADVSEVHKYKYTGAIYDIGRRGVFAQSVTDKHFMYLEDGSYVPVLTAINGHNPSEVPCVISPLEYDSPDEWEFESVQVEDIDTYCLSTTTKNFWVRHKGSGLVSLTGNSHSPRITKGVYQTGTSSRLKLEYNVDSPSGWLNTHCVVYPNGNRQLINVINGDWRL